MPSSTHYGVDLLRVPIIGPLMSRKWTRLCMQTAALLACLSVAAHAIWGPQLAAKNIGSLLTWVHFRGLIVFVILLYGNAFCMTCPFMLPRRLARFIAPAKFTWPARLRNKWPAITLFVLFLFAYEYFDLWSRPLWTGALIVLYLASALVVDGLFKRASFCKYVCPIGQFNFFGSAASPTEVAVRDAEICASCRTKDCIRGRRRNQADDDLARREAPGRELTVIQNGCELGLYLPRKVGNFDCTFCMDCVHACPHDNIGIFARLPGRDLLTEGPRSGIGRPETRGDYAAFASVFTFGALLNAFVMTSPVYALEAWISTTFGIEAEWPILLILFVVGLVLLPFLTIGAAALFTQRIGVVKESVGSISKRFALALVPMGFSIWTAHFLFHFLTGYLTIVPAFQNAVTQLCGAPLLGEPLWQLGGLSESTVFALEVGILTLGSIVSLRTAWSVASRLAPERKRIAFAPWGALHLSLLAASVWIMTQPMEMRGTFLS